MKQSNINVITTPEEKERQGTRAIFEEIMTKNFSQIVKHQAKDSKILTDPKQDKNFLKNYAWPHHTKAAK